MDKFYCETQLSDRISKTPEGFLVCHDVPITTAGDMYYKQDQFGSDIKSKNGHVRVSKTIEDIHSAETIRSFEGKPITLEHPTDAAGNNVFVTPQNAMNLSRGVIQNVRPGSGKLFDKLLADFVIMDEEAIALVESGAMREVSCGYNYDAANIQDGFFEQTNIRGNHVALVPRGRAGPQCAIFDSKEDKSMSLKDKLKDALSVIQDDINRRFKAADAMAEKDDEEDDEDEEDMPKKKAKGKAKDAPMATKMKKKKAKKAEAEDAADDEEDEDEMTQAEEDMGMVKVHSRLDRVESMLGDLVEQLRGMAEDDDDDEGEATDAAYYSEIISNAEIIAPGIAKSGKNLQRRALDECYKTEYGKKIINKLLSNKSFDSVDTEMLFTATASLLAEQRSSAMKQTSAYDANANKAPDLTKSHVLNKVNEDFWSKNTIGVIK